MNRMLACLLFAKAGRNVWPEIERHRLPHRIEESIVQNDMRVRKYAVLRLVLNGKDSRLAIIIVIAKSSANSTCLRAEKAYIGG